MQHKAGTSVHYYLYQSLFACFPATLGWVIRAHFDSHQKIGQQLK